MKIINKWWAWAAMAGVVTIAAMLFCPPVFYLNDDVTMRSIISGAYTGMPNGHAVYMKYPLTGILALLYKGIHFVPWFELFLAGSIWGCMLLLIYYSPKPYIGFGVAIVFYLPFSVYMHYTIVAALVAATAVFLVAMGRKGIWPVLLWIVSFLIRSQVGLLALPFVAAAAVWRLAVVDKEERKQESISWIKHGLLLIIGALLCSVIDYCFYASDDWKNYLEYNDSRTLLYDYTDFLSTDSYAQNYEAYGMTAQEYEILASYDTMLDAGIDKERMQGVAEKVANNMQSSNGIADGVRSTLQKYYLQVRYSDVPLNYLWMGAYLVLGICFLLGKKWISLAVLGILGAGRSCIWMYLIWRGRFPERVSVSLYMLELMLLLGMACYVIQSSRLRFLKFKQGISVLLCLCILAIGGYQWQATGQKVSEQERIQSEWTTLKWYCGETKDRLYLVDVFSAVEYADFLFAEDASNIMLLGGWMSASPLAQERFAKVGYTDGAECLYYGEHVSLIVEEGYDVTWIEEYLQNRFGDCSLKEVARINSREPGGFVEYRVARNEE